MPRPGGGSPVALGRYSGIQSLTFSWRGWGGDDALQRNLMAPHLSGLVTVGGAPSLAFPHVVLVRAREDRVEAQRIERWRRALIQASRRAQASRHVGGDDGERGVSGPQ
jgi:hypothetical protein